MNQLKSILLLTSLLILYPLKAKEADKLICMTDRDIYASGDRICVSLFLPVENTSRVVYVDLVDFSGTHISGIKLPVENHRAQGYVSIPDSLSTSTYLLRAFINNDHSRKFFVRDLLIANRFEDLYSEQKGSVRKFVDTKETKNTNEITISIPDIIKRRESAQLKLDIPAWLYSELDGALDIVVSKYTKEFQSTGKFYVLAADSTENIIIEDKGISITGKVIEKNSGMPVKNAFVLLSVPDSIPGFQYFFTKRDGLFYFLLNDIYGQVPVVIQTVKEAENDKLKIVLDGKFTWKMPEIPAEDLELNNDLIDQLAGTVESLTFQKIFDEAAISEILPANNFKTNLLFYGEPTYVIAPDQFYNLRDFTEISRELLTGVKLREKNEILTLNLVNRETNYFFDEQAFVLIDGIPVQDLNLLKNMGTSKIDWIHTVLEDRFFGDMNFPGVVAINTGSYDLKWLPESDRIKKIDYQAFQKKENNIQFGISRNSPDLRAVLFWESVTPRPELQFDFKISDITGAFRIRVSGKKKNGSLIVTEKIFHVN